jgi:hypothetical protein
MGRGERHRKLRPDVDAEQLQPGHSGRNRGGRQSQQYAADPDAV